MATTTRQTMCNNRDGLIAKAQAIIDGAENRDLTVAESEQIDEHIRSVKSINVALKADDDKDTKEAKQAASRVAFQELVDSGSEDDWDDDTPDTKAMPPRAWAVKTADAIGRGHRHIGTKALFSGTVSIPSVMVEPVANPQNARRLLQLVPQEPLGANNFAYYRQTARTNNAAVVPDGELKPTSVFTFTDVEDRARVVAHMSEPIPARFLQDQTEAVALLESEMASGVLDATEAQVLNGDGTGENFTGILSVTGINDVPYTTNLPTTLRHARTVAEMLNEVPTVWVFSPTDAEALDLLRESDATGDFLTLDRVLGDLPRIVSTALPAGTALLADWQQARLYVRESSRMDVDAGSGDMFAKNQVRLRAEQRVGFAVRRPQAFTVVHLTDPAA